MKTSEIKTLEQRYGGVLKGTGHTVTAGTVKVVTNQ